MDDRRPGRREAALQLLDRLECEGPDPGAARIGLTGSPGAGKSTLLDALVRGLRARERSVGIVAVDPSSRRTGGALLGDRFRVRSGAGDPGVFLRSMAARDRLGGLADATWPSVVVLSALFDVVFVETVGVGQSEGDVALLVDSLVFVGQPNAGDTLQFMKAGLLELPDVFVVNKADLGEEARRTLSELRAGLDLGEARSGGWTPPVFGVSARDGTGIDTLIQTLDAHREHLLHGQELGARRERGREAFVEEALQRRYGSYGLAALGGRTALEHRLREDRRSAFALVLALGREIEDALRKPA